jgi:hypothetical protein
MVAKGHQAHQITSLLNQQITPTPVISAMVQGNAIPAIHLSVRFILEPVRPRLYARSSDRAMHNVRIVPAMEL